MARNAGRGCGERLARRRGCRRAARTPSRLSASGPHAVAAVASGSHAVAAVGVLSFGVAVVSAPCAWSSWRAQHNRLARVKGSWLGARPDPLPSGHLQFHDTRPRRIAGIEVAGQATPASAFGRPRRACAAGYHARCGCAVAASHPAALARRTLGGRQCPDDSAVRHQEQPSRRPGLVTCYSIGRHCEVPSQLPHARLKVGATLTLQRQHTATTAAAIAGTTATNAVTPVAVSEDRRNTGNRCPRASTLA